MTWVTLLFALIWFFGAIVTRFDNDPWPHPANIICLIAALMFSSATVYLLF